MNQSSRADPMQSGWMKAIQNRRSRLCVGASLFNDIAVNTVIILDAPSATGYCQPPRGPMPASAMFNPNYPGVY